MGESHSFPGRVSAGIALALLASLRDVDTPSDPAALAETDLPLNLQRRLGLSSVVGDQIRRYEKRRGEAVSATEVASLFELIGRRADAGAIFSEAGRRIASEDLDGRRLAARLGVRVLPHGLRQRRAWRRVRRLARELSPRSLVRVDRKPPALVVEHGLPAHAAADGVGCAVLEGAIRRVFETYRAGAVQVLHTRCEGRDSDRCAWEISPLAEPDADSGVAESEREPLPASVEGNGASARPSAAQATSAAHDGGAPPPVDRTGAPASSRLTDPEGTTTEDPHRFQPESVAGG